MFDTNTVVSALLFRNGRLAWLRTHWRDRDCVPLISRQTADELNRVLSYPKCRLTSEDRFENLADYLPNCELIEVTGSCPAVCRHSNDQQFLDLAQCGRADYLVSGDPDLLALTGQTAFTIETPEAYRIRVLGNSG